MAEPMIRLEADASAPVLSYNVPEPVSYSGRNYIELVLQSPAFPSQEDWFRKDFTPIDVASRPGVLAPGLDRDKVRTELSKVPDVVGMDPAAFDALTTNDANLAQLPALAQLVNQATAISQSGRSVVITRSLSGSLVAQVRPTTSSRPGNATEPPSRSPGVTEVLLGVHTPRDGDVLSGPAGGVTVIVSGSARVVQGEGSIQAVEVQVGTGEAKAATPSAPGDFGSWSATVILGTAGPHTLTVRASHSSGQLVRTQTITVYSVLTARQPEGDSTPPALAIDSPTDDGWVTLALTPPGPVTIGGSAHDAESGIAQVEVAIAGGSWTPATPKAQDDWSTWAHSIEVQGYGSHTVAARATDKAGNTTEGTVRFTALQSPPATPILHRLLLAETVRLSSYLGAYGAGRTIKTLSLLPGEKSKLAIKTYQRSESTAKHASSIFDSLNESSASEFQQSMQREQSSKQSFEETSNYKVGVEAGLNLGVFSAKASAEFSGGSNAAREQMAKNTASATQKHAAQASAKRDVKVETSFETKEEAGEETAIQREIENINLSRTLNFVFRQMNQEFISILHLVDVRVGYYRVDLDPESGQEVPTYREATLPQLDSFLAEIIVPERRQEVREAILRQLKHVMDYKDQPQEFIHTATFKDKDGEIPNSGYLRVRKDLSSTYQDLATETTIEVPGVILAATKNTLRTDGIIVEAVLGQGNALDEYSQGLQQAAVKAKELANAQLEQATAKEQLALKVIVDKDDKAAELFSEIYPSETTESLALVAAQPNSNGGQVSEP